ncbi:YafY family protein [Olivibacter sp. CPCC 100613]|uniref:helix-turn-helix transcriptional regulator n=1 Tax=Olivibacter sp. CPCC 100613 TaxID=3079931 RepID=UPI002FFABF3F
MDSENFKRFDRLVAIFIQLQSKRIVKAQELADRFQVSLRTIYRDIKALELSGVPIYSEAGVGYSLIDSYRLPPLSLNKEEATSLVAAEKLMQKFGDKTIHEHFSSAMYKIKTALKTVDKEWVSSIESQVVMQPLQIKFSEKAPHALATLFESIARKTQVELLYRALDATQATRRLIEPVGVFHQHHSWHVIGFCHLRNDYRQFRTDRIEEIKNTELPFERKHQPLDFYLVQKDQPTTTSVRIAVEKDMAKYLQWDRNFYGFVSEERFSDKVIMNFEVRDTDEAFSRWFLMFADKATILEPSSLKIKVQRLLTKQLARINEENKTPQ